MLNTHDVTTAFDDADLDAVAVAYSGSLQIVGAALDSGNMSAVLECEPIRPLFRVRS